MIRRGLGYREDPPKGPGDKVDFDAGAKLRAGPIPPRASNRHLVVDILDQGGLGSCVANAVMQAIRASQIMNGALTPPPLGSRLWTYYLARAYTNEQLEDNGTFIRNAFAALVKWGFPPESVMPYTDQGDEFRRMPRPFVFREAYDQRTPTEYLRIFETGAARVLAVKRALSQGFLVCFGTDVSNRFAGNDLGRGPVLPPIGEPIAGGHAMVLVGYDGDSFDVVNSWGDGWGDRGYWTMSADYLAWERTRDCWIVQSSPQYSSEVAP
jgi:C1A family cysteine protease